MGDLWCGTPRGPAGMEISSIADGDCLSWKDDGSFEISLKYVSTASYPYILYQGASCDASLETRSYQDGICGSLPTSQQAYGGKGIKFGSALDMGISANSCSDVADCTGYSLKNCLEAHPGCQAECESKCPDKCSGCTCGSLDCNQWMCNACLPECGDCYGMAQCCPHEALPFS